MKYSIKTFSDARNKISRYIKRRITFYTRRDVTSMLNSDTDSENKYWKTLTELARILHHHPNQIVRHEAAFVFGDFQYKNELENNIAIYHLRLSIRRDPSIVGRHESVEALGECATKISIGAAVDLVKLIKFKNDHPDVIKTAEGSLENILEYLEKQGLNEAVKEIRRLQK